MIAAVAIVALALALVGAVGGFASVLRSTVRQQARERSEMLDRVMHLAGATWTPPPADTYTPAEDDEPEPERFLSTTAQLPEL